MGIAGYRAERDRLRVKRERWETIDATDDLNTYQREAVLALAL